MFMVGLATACSGGADSHISEPHIQQGGAGTEAPLVRVPDLIGYPLEELTLEFSNLGFTPSLLMFISDEPINTVLSIKRVGQLAPAYSTIDVYVSAGSPDWDTEVVPGSELPAQQKEYDRMEFGGISWLVLEDIGDRVLLLSEFVLFDMRYNDTFVSTTWETSTLRSYLNNEFFNSFSPEERGRITETRIENADIQCSFPSGELGQRIQTWPVPAGNDTYDKVFLLSYDEQRRYFVDDAARLARMTDDHPRQGSGYAHWWWLLRSPRTCTFTVSGVSYEGWDFIGYPVNMDIGVRPALWLYVGE